MKNKNIVAVTGIGAVTCLGWGSQILFDGLCACKNGIQYVPEWQEAGFPVQVAGLVPDREKWLERFPEIRPFHSRKALFAAGALSEALTMAGPTACREGQGGLFLGIETGRIRMKTLHDMFRQSGTPKGIDNHKFGEQSFRFLTAEEAFSKQPFFIPRLLARLNSLSGCVRAVSNACSSANQAIGEAYREVASGRLDWAITGGADDMVDEYMAIGFNLLGALAVGVTPDSASMPFDAGRKGFVLGEGAGMLVLEPLSRALARGAKPLALISGYGSGASATKITETTWEGIYQTMGAALAEGGLTTAEVDYINAHGTGTPMNDPAETKAIKQLFGERAGKIPVNSTKSMTGHLIAAAAAVEAVVCVQSIRHEMVHPTRGLQRPDPACDLDYVPKSSRSVKIRNALSNSLGFAGINSTLVFSRQE